MFQPVLQVVAQLDSVLPAVVFEVLEQALLVITEKLAHIWLLQEVHHVGRKLPLSVPLPSFSLLVDQVLELLLLLLFFERLLLLLLRLSLALLGHVFELVVELFLLLAEELTLLLLLL